MFKFLLFYVGVLINSPTAEEDIFYLILYVISESYLTVQLEKRTYSNSGYYVGVLFNSPTTEENNIFKLLSES